MRKGFYMRPVKAIIDEIKYLNKNHQINHFQFSDELLMASKARTEEICEAILKLPFRIKWDCNGRLNFAKPATLKLMKRAGCEYINYGIESLAQDQLNSMGKGLTLAQINQGVEATLKERIFPGLNLIWGFPGDTVKNLQAAVAFLKRYDPCHELRTIRPVTPYPGTALYSSALKQGLLSGPKDFYENKHKNSDLISVNFMDIPTGTAHLELKLANRELYDNYLRSHRMDMWLTTEQLYSGKDTNFRGFRAV
jgi:anaerobic magnesium-protoporphyrin IX monomethyl ester cyclase